MKLTHKITLTTITLTACVAFGQYTQPIPHVDIYYTMQGGGIPYASALPDDSKADFSDADFGYGDADRLEMDKLVAHVSAGKPTN